MERRDERGWVEVIAGPMFSGKSEELIRRITRYQIARLATQTFKPVIDDRYASDEVVSHSRLSVAAEPVADSAELLRLVHDRTVVVGIDEGQFFDESIVEMCSRLAEDGKRVIVAGLDQDYLGRPFEPMPQLMAVAEYVTKLHAVCVVCGAPANHSQRLIAKGDRLLLGAKETYEPRCRRCFEPANAHPRPASGSVEGPEPGTLSPDAEPA